MPDLYTHYVAAEKIAAKYSIPFSPLYQLGCQGGDFGYFYFSLGKSIGSAAHNDAPHCFFCSMAEYCNVCPAMYPYALGYLTHYCMDVAFHPYVNSLAAKGYAHTTAERAIDAFFFEINGRKKYSLPVNLVSRGEGEKLSDMLSFSLKRKISYDKLFFSFKALEFATVKLLRFISPHKQFPSDEGKKWLTLMQRGEDFFSAVYGAFENACLKGESLRKDGFIRDFSGEIL